MVNVKRYYGRTAREALRMVKEELGPDAVVLSNRAVNDGVEILALPAEEVGAVQSAVRRVNAAAEPVRSPVSPALAEEDGEAEDFHVSLSTRVARAPMEASGGPGLPAGVPHMVSDQRAQVRPFIPPRVDNWGNPVPSVVRPQVQPEPLFAARRELEAERARPLDDGYRAIRAAYDDGAEIEPRREPAREMPREREPLMPREREQPPRRAEPAREIERPRQSSSEARAAAEEDKVRALETANAHLMGELGAIRGMIERQLAGFAWGELTRGAPIRAQAMSDLLEAGFSAQLARELVEAVPAEAPHDEARNLLRAQINRRLLTLESESDLIERGGVYALVGPTGVGKTTTTAKLAARCVVRHGADKLALITTDGYRIGAHEQLRIYGRILGVQVHAVRDAADLRRTLQDLSGKHMVLIDTIGMSQRDKMVADQAAMLAGAGCVRRLLLLNATARGDTLEDVLRAYEGPDLAGCILSKTDEAASLGPVLDVLIRHELRAFYVANGQRVPEDLHLPNRAWLVHRALRELSPESPFRISAEDAGLLAASRPGAQAAQRGGRQ
ncbi:flagellar biosynthesis protein FlhF [Niveibacterium sp. SC-1]|uniref:flagellar biosynthesis protein FlhF n=1 Tax=Niveibacterium sp. SC-1 TaxID=3135646 RepID=UPI00311F34A6